MTTKDAAPKKAEVTSKSFPNPEEKVEKPNKPISGTKVTLIVLLVIFGPLILTLVYWLITKIAASNAEAKANEKALDEFNDAIAEAFGKSEEEINAINDESASRLCEMINNSVGSKKELASRELFSSVAESVFSDDFMKTVVAKKDAELGSFGSCANILTFSFVGNLNSESPFSGTQYLNKGSDFYTESTHDMRFGTGSDDKPHDFVNYFNSLEKISQLAFLTGFTPYLAKMMAAASSAYQSEVKEDDIDKLNAVLSCGISRALFGKKKKTSYADYTWQGSKIPVGTMRKIATLSKFSWKDMKGNYVLPNITIAHPFYGSAVSELGGLDFANARVIRISAPVSTMLILAVETAISAAMRNVAVMKVGNHAALWTQLRSEGTLAALANRVLMKHEIGDIISKYYSLDYTGVKVRTSTVNSKESIKTLKKAADAFVASFIISMKNSLEIDESLGNSYKTQQGDMTLKQFMDIYPQTVLASVESALIGRQCICISTGLPVYWMSQFGYVTIQTSSVGTLVSSDSVSDLGGRTDINVIQKDYMSGDSVNKLSVEKYVSSETVYAVESDRTEYLNWFVRR